VLDSLTVFEQKESAAVGNTVSAEDPDIVRNHAYELSFASEDEMFHSTLYDWLIHRQMADELLEVCICIRILSVSYPYVYPPDAARLPRSSSTA
jgi:hypothetical protein